MSYIWDRSCNNTVLDARVILLLSFSLLLKMFWMLLLLKTSLIRREYTLAGSEMCHGEPTLPIQQSNQADSYTIGKGFHASWVTFKSKHKRPRELIEPSSPMSFLYRSVTEKHPLDRNWIGRITPWEYRARQNWSTSPRYVQQTRMLHPKCD